MVLLKYWCLIVLIKKSMCFIMKTFHIVKVTIKAKLITMAKTICQIKHKKRNISINKCKKVEKALNKSMKNALYDKAMENLRNGIDLRFASNKKEVLEWTSNPTYICHKKYLTMI